MNTLLERFLRYVKIDTQSVSNVEAFPSSEKQRDLLEMLYAELQAMHVDASYDAKYGYVYAKIPSNTGSKYKLGLIAHVDTSDAVSGKNVQPIITENYNGKTIALAQKRTLSPEEFPELSKFVGQTIVSSDGTTLLGADDKAGVAVIMEVVKTLVDHPEIQHSEICIAFTPDEEVGRGTEFFDLKKFGANGGYTIDGGGLGELEYENFNAASATVRVTGKAVHPGIAKNSMVNAILVLMELQSMLPTFQNPMYTQGYEGFYHLEEIEGACDAALARYIIRDHDMQKFQQKKELFRQVAEFLNTKYGKGTVNVEIRDTYYNMKEKILPHIHLVENACAAMEKAGVQPVVTPIRGGTDGARLSFQGMPCPNLFTGGHNAHSRYEYLVLEETQKSFETVLNIIDLYKNRMNCQTKCNTWKENN